MSFLPPDADVASSILGIISDPAAAKKRMEELVSLQKQAETAMDNAREAQKAAEAKVSQATDTLNQLKGVQENIDAQRADIANRTQELNDKVAKYSQDATQMASEARTVALRKQELDNTAQELASQRASLGDLEASLNKRSQDLTDAMNAHQAKVEQLKAFLN